MNHFFRTVVHRGRGYIGGLLALVTIRDAKRVLFRDFAQPMRKGNAAGGRLFYGMRASRVMRLSALSAQRSRKAGRVVSSSAGRV